MQGLKYPECKSVLILISFWFFRVIADMTTCTDPVTFQELIQEKCFMHKIGYKNFHNMTHVILCKIFIFNFVHLRLLLIQVRMC